MKKDIGHRENGIRIKASKKEEVNFIDYIHA